MTKPTLSNQTKEIVLNQVKSNKIIKFAHYGMLLDMAHYIYIPKKINTTELVADYKKVRPTDVPKRVSSWKKLRK